MQLKLNTSDFLRHQHFPCWHCSHLSYDENPTKRKKTVNSRLSIFR